MYQPGHTCQWNVTGRCSVCGAAMPTTPASPTPIDDWSVAGQTPRWAWDNEQCPQRGPALEHYIAGASLIAGRCIFCSGQVVRPIELTAFDPSRPTEIPPYDKVAEWHDGQALKALRTRRPNLSQAHTRAARELRGILLMEELNPEPSL